MLVLPGYSICQEIDDNNGVRIYRGYRTKDRMPVFIKAINKETVNPVEISKLMYEYEITQKIGIEGVIKPVSLEQSESVLALVVEDFGAISMSEYIKNYPVSLSVFLDIAVQLKETLSWLHQKWGLAHSPVGRLDVLPGLLQPQVLYGREKEKELLAAAFRSACDGKKETILVSGYPGIGKTMLINKTLRSVAQQKGYYITGKFDQLRKNIPYAAFAEAFRGLVSQLMTKGQGKLDWWKKKLQKAIANNGAVVTEIIPELEWIIGKQNPVETLSHKEAENRFFMVFTEFVKALSWKGHPLVLFLDDLQWADIASINLMRHLAQDTKLSSLLLVGAFRGNEISPEHPLTAMLSEANTEQPTIKHISLMPLELDEAAKLVAGMLNTEQENVSLLSEELYRKSGGNSFFLRELLMYIYEEKLLFFDVQEGIWKWELGSIKNLQPGEDVLDIIAKKLQKLPTETIEVIKLAACIGNRFDMETLAAVYDKSKEETVYRLMPSILAGLILISKKQKSDSSIDYTEVKNSTFEFLHDRVQQTVYSQIPEKEKKEKHITIGRLLLEKASYGDLEEKIQLIMDHFNRSLELIHDAEERVEFAEYNLLAGRKAKVSAAYESAYKYFKSGKMLLPENAWENNYQLCYELHLELAQAEYLSANAEAAEQLFDTVIEKAADELERARVYGLKLVLYADVGKYTEAVHTGIRALKNLGIKVPIYPSMLDYAKELLLYKWYMRNRRIEDFIYMPEIENPVHRVIIELLSRMAYATMSSYPDLYSYIILKTGNHAVRYGNTELSCVGYLGYSITAGCILGDYEAGERYGRVTIQLVEKYNRSFSKCITYFVVGSLVSHWTQHGASGLDYLEKAAENGIEAGDVLITGYAHCLHLENQYLIGVKLSDIAEQVVEKHEIAKRLKHENLSINAEIYESVVSALLGYKSDSLESGVAEYDRDELAQLAQRDKSSHATYYIYKMQLQYMSGNYRDALTEAQKVKSLTGSIIGFLISVEYNFYYSLIITAVFNELSYKEQRRYMAILKKNQRQMKRWARYCKENFEHKYLLVAAEVARLQNRKGQAMSLYDRAIRSAHKNHYLNNEALANELAAIFYLSSGLDKMAEVYMLDACDRYRRWGAATKVKELQNRYPELFGGADCENKKYNADTAIANLVSISAPMEREAVSSLDAYFLDKAMESITNEVDIDTIFKSFLDITAKSIGADKGYLILEKDGELFIEAAMDSGSGEMIVKTAALEECDEIAKSVVRYSARTLETVVLNCREQPGVFIGDSYIAKANPDSIVCLPLFLHGISFGVLYLESSLLTVAITEDSLNTLKLLSTKVTYAEKLQSYLKNYSDQIKKEEFFRLADQLNDREVEVLRLIAAGLSDKEIAERLIMAVNTVKSYIINLYEKLQVNRRVQMVERAKVLHFTEEVDNLEHKDWGNRSEGFN